MKPEAAMIFAAGLGTRMGALTRDRPKPLIEVSGKPLIGHALALVREAGLRRVAINIHAHADRMRAWLAAEAPDVLVSHEPELLETGGGLKRALPLLGDGPVVTLNADMVWTGPNPVERLVQAWNDARMDGLLSLVPRRNATGHSGPGDFDLDADGALARRGGTRNADFVYSGAGVVDTAMLAGFDGAFSLNPVWDRMIGESRLFGVTHPGGWVDVGRPDGIALAEAALAE